jgi:hypothetical protein
VLVIGANTLHADCAGTPLIGRTRPERTAIHEFVVRGGRLAVLHQDDYPEGMFDIQLTDQRSTMAFRLNRGWFAELDLEHYDPLRFWRGDHFVATREPSRPTTGGFWPFVVSGSSAGIEHCPMLFQELGRGCILYSQLLAVEKFQSEPAAAEVLGDTIEYLLAYEARTQKTALVGGDKAYRQYLRSLGLRFDDLTGRLDAAGLRPYGLLVCRGELGTMPQMLREFVGRGGHLYLHRPTDESMKTFCREIASDLAMQPYSGPVSRTEEEESIVANFVVREDLYWLGKHVGIDWADTPRATNMADGVFVKTLANKKPTVYEIEDWRLEGGIVERVPPGVTFATVGSASKKIRFPEAGGYVIGLLARGTPSGGEYPRAEIKIDGKLFGTVAVSSSDWHIATTFGAVSKGEHEVSVEFVNDGSNPPKEDRNLFADKVLVARDDGDQAVTFLTSPPAIAEIKRGRGKVLIDLVRWDTEEHNARKAARLASTLLTEMGGDFQPRMGTTIECERMTPQPGMPHFSNQGGHAALACNGYIQTPIQVAATGRYSMELVASGSPAAGVYPLVEIAIDGKKAGQVQLTSGNWRSYFLDLDLPAESHELRLSFVNDFNVNGEDRNVMLDKASFYRE